MTSWGHDPDDHDDPYGPDYHDNPDYLDDSDGPKKNYGLAWPLWDHSFFFFCLSSLFSLSSELQRFYKNDLDTNAGTSENICTPLPSHEAKHCVQ